MNEAEDYADPHAQFPADDWWDGLTAARRRHVAALIEHGAKPSRINHSAIDEHVMSQWLLQARVAGSC